MKYLILAAGYGTRLERDVRDDASGRFAHLVGVPKPLVPLVGKALTTYWVEALRACGVNLARDAFLVTNASNYSLFERWAHSCDFPLSNLINDGSTDNLTRMGAIRDIAMVIEKLHLADDLCVLGGDTLFFDTFSLQEVVEHFVSRRAELGGVVLWYTCPDNETTRTGILESSASTHLVSAFIEKPQPQDTPSRQACPCFYIYNRSVLPLIVEYVRQNQHVLQRVDAPGTLVTYMCARTPVLAYQIDGRFDIGGLDTFIEADAYFAARRNSWTNGVLMGPKKKHDTTATASTGSATTAPAARKLSSGACVLAAVPCSDRDQNSSSRINPPLIA